MNLLLSEKKLIYIQIFAQKIKMHWILYFTSQNESMGLPDQNTL